jgi:AcrR family transcriptional regulator
MPNNALSTFEPRKTPVQARSTVTVEAICEAAIQVLLSHGADKLTTTRVAERAGVSVGTLYQYYPNKESLLAAVFEDHLNKVTVAMEAACREAHGKPLAEMIHDIVIAFVDIKMRRSDISVALYKVSLDVGGPATAKKAIQRMRKAADAIIQTAPDAEPPPDKVAVDVMFAAMGGVMKTMLESGASAAVVRNMRDQLVLLCQSYLAATARRS